MFFDQYKVLCRKYNKTPNGVAKELGFASSSITQWKHGSTPRPEKLRQICDYFHVDEAYLLGFSVDAQIDVTEYYLSEVEKKLKTANDDERYKLECDYDLLKDSLDSLRMSAIVEKSRATASKVSSDNSLSDDDTAFLQTLHDSPGMRIMFSTSKNRSEADIREAAAIIEAFYKTKDGKVQ